jgi:hypothetical protein
MYELISCQDFSLISGVSYASSFKFDGSAQQLQEPLNVIAKIGILYFTCNSLAISAAFLHVNVILFYLSCV